jgi:hypothetical protein
MTRYWPIVIALMLLSDFGICVAIYTLVRLRRLERRLFPQVKLSPQEKVATAAWLVSVSRRGDEDRPN